MKLWWYGGFGKHIFMKTIYFLLFYSLLCLLIYILFVNKITV
jgi:hypothetical protein